MTCALHTPSAPILNTRFPWDISAQSTGTNWIWSWSGVLLSRMFSTHTLSTVQTALRTTLWCAVRSGCNQRNSTAQKHVKMSQPDLTEQFVQTFEKEFGSLQPGDSATEKWEALRDTMYRTALTTFGKRSSTSHDWFEAKSTVINPVIEAKRAALAEYRHEPTEGNLQILRIAGSKAQQIAQCCANEYWKEHPLRRHNGKHQGNVWRHQKALGPTLNKTAPFRSSTREFTKDKGHQLERWVEHYSSDLYPRENIVTLSPWCCRVPWKN